MSDRIAFGNVRPLLFPLDDFVTRQYFGSHKVRTHVLSISLTNLALFPNGVFLFYATQTNRSDHLIRARTL